MMESNSSLVWGRANNDLPRTAPPWSNAIPTTLSWIPRIQAYWYCTSNLDTTRIDSCWVESWRRIQLFGQKSPIELLVTTPTSHQTSLSYPLGVCTVLRQLRKWDTFNLENEFRTPRTLDSKTLSTGMHELHTNWGLYLMVYIHTLHFFKYPPPEQPYGRKLKKSLHSMLERHTGFLKRSQLHPNY